LLSMSSESDKSNFETSIPNDGLIILVLLGLKVTSLKA